MAGRGRRALAQAAALSWLAAVTACRAPPGAEPAPPASAAAVPQLTAGAGPPPPPSTAASAAPPPPPRLPRIAAPSGFESLPVPGFGEATVSIPVDTSQPRALVVALHGNFDRPEWQCQVWRRITSAEQFVLCPRGVPRRDVPKHHDRWEWGSLAQTQAELSAALSAARERYGAHIESGPIVFTGFSLGAILGARLLDDPQLNIGAAVLVEGGYQGWTLPKSKQLAKSLRHVLFGCGQTECRNAYRFQLEALFKKAGLPSSMVADVKAGHTYDDPVAALIQQEWPALIASLKEEAETPP